MGTHKECTGYVLLSQKGRMKLANGVLPAFYNQLTPHQGHRKEEATYQQVERKLSGTEKSKSAAPMALVSLSGQAAFYLMDSKMPISPPPPYLESSLCFVPLHSQFFNL